MPAPPRVPRGGGVTSGRVGRVRRRRPEVLVHGALFAWRLRVFGVETLVVVTVVVTAVVMVA